MRVDYNILKWYDSLAEQEYRKPYAYSAVPTLPIEQNQVPPFQLIRARTGAAITQFDLVNFKTGDVTDVLSAMETNGLSVLQPANKTYDIIYYPSTVRLDADLERGGYYAVMSDGQSTWYSDVFTMMPYLGDHIKLEWCHNRDFEFTGGHIQYTSSGYGNGYKTYLWIDTYLVKPKYEYVREVKERDGLEFPVRLIRKKVYRFEYIGPESIIDALSVVELHDMKKVTDQHGREFQIVECEMSDPEWFNPGNTGRVTFDLVTEKVVVATYGNGTATGTCEVAAGTCIAPTGSYYAVQSDLVEGSVEWVNGFYYDGDGVPTDLSVGDYVTAGASGTKRLYKYNAPNDYTVQDISGYYSKIYYRNTNEYWYDRGEGLNIRKSVVRGFTPATSPPTFYGQTGNDEAIYQLWLEDAGGGQAFVQTTDNSEFDTGIQVETTGFAYLVLKTVTVKCGTIMEDKFEIPLDYMLYTMEDDDFSYVFTTADDNTDYVLGDQDLPSVTIP